MYGKASLSKKITVYFLTLKLCYISFEHLSIGVLVAIRVNCIKVISKVAAVLAKKIFHIVKAR